TGRWKSDQKVAAVQRRQLNIFQRDGDARGQREDHVRSNLVGQIQQIIHRGEIEVGEIEPVLAVREVRNRVVTALQIEDEAVAPVAARQVVISLVAAQTIASNAAIEDVIAFITTQSVIAGEAQQGIIAF